MVVDTSKLVRIATYAKMIEKTPIWVHQLIKKGEVECVKIDEVFFVKLS